jgi:hypothetical protein
MKTLTKVICLVLSLSTFSYSLRQRPFTITPKGLDLTDHFGTESANSAYGPKERIVGDLAREGIVTEGVPITPITNFNKEINPTQVVAGDLDNTAFDASKIIKAEYAGMIYI